MTGNDLRPRETTMKLTMHLKKRWIRSILREAEKGQHPMPWHRGKDQKPLGRRLVEAQTSAGSSRA